MGMLEDGMKNIVVLVLDMKMLMLASCLLLLVSSWRIETILSAK